MDADLRSSFVAWDMLVFGGECPNVQCLHPGRLTWNIIMEVWKIIFLSKWVIYMFHVNLPGCNSKGNPIYPCFAYPRHPQPKPPNVAGIPKHKLLVGGLGYETGVCWKGLGLSTHHFWRREFVFVRSKNCCVYRVVEGGSKGRGVP